MSVKIMGMVYGMKMPALKTDKGRNVPDTTCKSILLALADNCNDYGEGAYPGVDELCDKTDYSTATVVAALNALKFGGFLKLEGISRLNTNNYTVLAAKILEFQRLKRGRFSGQNDTVLAAKTNPSLTIKQPSLRETEEIKAKADKMIDGILENEKKSAGKSWTKIPDPFQAYGEAFCNSTTLVYSKRDAMDWISTFSDWMNAGYTPGMISEAVKAICAMENAPAISRPGSITWKLKDIKVKAANAPKKTEKKTSEIVIPDAWRALYNQQDAQ